jgi:methionyl-tRNA formyltransferase
MFYRATKGKDLLPGSTGALPPAVAEQARKHSIPLISFDAINDDRSIAAVRNYHPDFIVLGGAPLLKRGIRDVPRYGVINAHPAKLPDIRGMDVVAWSILQGVPLGLTVFFIDAGVDTGPILYFHPVADTAGLTLEEIMEHLQAQAGKAVVHTIQGFLAGTLKPVSQKPADGKLYTAMPRAIRIRVQEVLAMRT